MIVNLPIEKLEPHPDNPRKSLGDLTELANSIRQSGLMQNLTVVPAPGKPGEYRVVIGHRRLAAAKMAGLTELPCSIEPNMSETMQIATMLAENMQRNALTVADQVGGVQMMMDLGESAKAIAEKTGLSGETVRRRMRLAELQLDKLKTAEARGATIEDLIKITKIEDPEQREKLMDAAGTENFEVEHKRAYKRQRAKYALEKNRAIIEQWAKIVSKEEYQKDARKLNWIGRIELGEENPNYDKPAGRIEHAEYICVRYEDHLTVYMVCGKTENDQTAAEQMRMEAEKKKRQVRIEACEAMKRLAKELRYDFIKNHFRGGGAYITAAAEFARDALMIKDSFGLDSRSKEMYNKIIGDRPLPNPALEVAVAAYCTMEQWYNTLGYSSWDGKFAKQEKLDVLYANLKKLGYQMSDEEIAWQQGKHPCFFDPVESGDEQ